MAGRTGELHAQAFNWNVVAVENGDAPVTPARFAKLHLQGTAGLVATRFPVAVDGAAAHAPPGLAVLAHADANRAMKLHLGSLKAHRRNRHVRNAQVHLPMTLLRRCIRLKLRIHRQKSPLRLFHQLERGPAGAHGKLFFAFENTDAQPT